MAGLTVWLTVRALASEPPEITSIQPAALQPGATNWLRVEGHHLRSIRAMWTTWSGVLNSETAGFDHLAQDSLQVGVFVPEGLPLGIEMLRLLGTNGVSNARLVLIDDLPRASALGTNDAPSRASSLQPPIAIEDECVATGSRYYHLNLDKGQRLAFEIVANRLGWPTDPVMRILKAHDQEILYVNDTPGLGSDGAAEFRAASGGDYLVEVRDAAFSGGDNYRYQLRIGPFPVAILPRVPVVSVSSPDRCDWESSITSKTGRARIVPCDSGADPVARLRLRRRAREALTPRLAVSPHPLAAEREPDDTVATASPIDPSHRISGRFDAAGDADFYRIDITTPGLWTFRVRSRSLGLASDPLLRLVDASGQSLASGSEDSPDPIVHYHFKSPGTFLLEVEEAAGRFGAGRSYILEATDGDAGFEISTESDRIHVPAGGREVLKIKIERHGYGGPIRLEGEGLSVGFAFENAVVAAGKKEWDLGIRCAADVEAGTWCRPVIFGRPQNDDETAMPSTTLDLEPARRALFPRLLTLPGGFLEKLWLCAIPSSDQEGTTNDTKTTK